MIISIQKNTPQKKVDKLIDKLKSASLNVVMVSGVDFDVINVFGNTLLIDEKDLKQYDFVKSVQKITQPFNLTSRKNHPEDSVYQIKDVFIGGNNFSMIAGPCSIESKEQLEEIATFLVKNKVKFLRAGAFKPRTSPYSYQGMGEEGLKILKDVCDKYELVSVSEITDTKQIDLFKKYVDIVQVGTRNMQNYELLKELGKINKPILLKRGFANTIEEFLLAAEYLMINGNSQIILCERGIRTFEKYTRFTLDLACVPLVKKLSHLPIIVDPSHSSGRYDLVKSMSLAAISAGTDGLILEIHNHPECALSDGAQSLKFKNFKSVLTDSLKIAKVVGKKI